MVISSSAGDQSSFTGLPQFKNHSAFGESLLELFHSKSQMTINQLVEPLNTLVINFTHGDQQPTIRATNLEQNFQIW
jgi:hypothetical protein